jgi:DNA-binding MarR family transcriptional regulator
MRPLDLTLCIGFDVGVSDETDSYKVQRAWPLSSLDAPLDLEEHLPFRVAVLSNLLRVDRDPLVRRITSLGARELRVLLNVGSFMPVSAADVAYQSRLDTHTVSRAVKRLMADGLVASANDTFDKRKQVLQLSPFGRDLYQQLADLLRERELRLRTVLSDAEANTLRGLLRRLEGRAEQVLAEEVLQCVADGAPMAADQKELLRWHRRRRSIPGAQP